MYAVYLVCWSVLIWKDLLQDNRKRYSVCDEYEMGHRHANIYGRNVCFTDVCNLQNIIFWNSMHIR